MGLLEDAIRDHLELKRRQGASHEELAREESEALGPADQEPVGPEPVPAEAEMEPEPPASEPAPESTAAPPIDHALEAGDSPDFVEETPEHDRLAVEQKPPRDFDFD